MGGYIKGNVAAFVSQPETFFLEVDIETTAGFVVSMAHVVPEHRFHPGYITYATQNTFLNYIYYLLLFTKKAREFTGLCVFDKWKGYKCL